MPASRHMRPPKTTVALRVARMLADGWHIEPCGRVSPQSHEQRKRGPFPGLAGLPSPLSVRLLVSPSAASLLHQLCSWISVWRAALQRQAPCSRATRHANALPPRNSLPLGPQGLSSPPISRPGSPARDMPRPACTIRTARAASFAGSPPKARAKTTDRCSAMDMVLRDGM